MRIPLLMLASACVALGAGCFAEEIPEPREPVATFVGIDAAVGRRMVDSVFWYTGFRPDSIVVEGNRLRVGMPGGSLGERREFTADGCRSYGAPPGIIEAVARHALRNIDTPISIETVDISIGTAEISQKRWFGRYRSCGGSGNSRINVADLSNLD